MDAAAAARIFILHIYVLFLSIRSFALVGSIKVPLFSGVAVLQFCNRVRMKIIPFYSRQQLRKIRATVLNTYLQNLTTRNKSATID